MSSLPGRRVVRRSVPAKISIVDGKTDGVGDTAADSAAAAANKENVLNCSLYSLFQSHYERSQDSPSTPVYADKVNGAVLQPRKRALNEQGELSAMLVDRSCELSPPELTTSDTFKPAKRTLAPKQQPQPHPKQQQQAGAGEEDRVRLQLIKTPGPVITESCDVLVSSPTASQQMASAESHLPKAWSSGRREAARKPPTPGRSRVSTVRVSIGREGGATILSSKRDGSSSAKKRSAIGDRANGASPEGTGKDMVSSAQKRTPVAEQAKMEVERARSKVLERRKSFGQKAPLVGNKGIGSCGVKPDILRKDGSVEKTSPVAAAQQSKTGGKTATETIRTRKLSMVLKNEQRLAEKNEQYGLQLRPLQDQIEEKDHEVEKMRSAGLMLNNMINRQNDEIRELRFRLKETFNENAEVRRVCEALERELRKTREVFKLGRMQKLLPKQFDPELTTLTTQLQSMAICMREAPIIESRIEEGREDCETNEGHQCQEVAKAQECLEAQGEPEIVSKEENRTNQDLPPTSSDDDLQYTLEDLQEMVIQEEDLLKQRCANALKELNLPLTPLLTSKGSLDVSSLKAALASIGSKEEYLSAEKKSCIRSLSAWIGSD